MSVRLTTRKENRGFTLTEVLVGCTILSMIGVLTFGTFQSAVEARDRIEAMTQRYHQLRQGLERMSRELQTAFLSEHRDCDDPQAKTIFEGKSSSHGMRLNFTSFSHFKFRADANESDQNELSYFIQEDAEDSSKLNLYRREAARIDADPDEGGHERVLVRNVEDLTFEFYDGKKKEWEDSWDSNGMDQKGLLPQYVKIALKVKDHMGESMKVVTKTRLFINRSLLISGSRCID